MFSIVMKEYILQNNWKEITLTQKTDPDLIIKILNKDGITISDIKDAQYQCKIQVIDSNVSVHGHIRICAYGHSVVDAYDNVNVVAMDYTIVNAYCNSFVQVFNNSIGKLYDRSRAHVYDFTHVSFYGKSSGKIYSSSPVYVYDNASIDMHSDSIAKLFNNSNVTIYNICACIEAYHNAIVYNPFNSEKYKLFGNSIEIKPNLVLDFTKWCEYNAPVKFIDSDHIILYKKISSDYKTQEYSPNETSWLPGTVVEIPIEEWNPAHRECGPGKFHACATPMMCDKFRPKNSDKYIAILVNIKDLYVWHNIPEYPEKIAFRKGIVLYECNKDGIKF